MGFALFDSVSHGVIAFVLSFAGGAILTMLADTMMPEAFEHGGNLVGVVTTFGFAVAFAISSLQTRPGPARRAPCFRSARRLLWAFRATAA